MDTIQVDSELLNLLKVLGYEGQEQWEWSPDTIELMSSHIWECDDKDCPYDWHQEWVGLGLYVEGDKVGIVEAICDMDYEWESEYGEYITTMEEFVEAEARNRAECDEAEAYYLRCMAESGDDPIGLFLFGPFTADELKAKAQNELRVMGK